MSISTFVSGKGRAREGTVHCRYSEEERTRFSLNNLRYGKLPDCHHKGRFRHTLQHVPNFSHWASLSNREEPGAHPEQPPTIREASPCDCSTAGRLQTFGRETGPSPGAGSEAARAGPGEPRVTHGAHVRPAGRPAPLGARQGRARTPPRAAAYTKSEKGRPRPRAGELGGNSGVGPCPPHRPPSRTEPSLPTPASPVRGHHPHIPKAPTSLAAAAAAPSPPAPPPYSGGRAAPRGANRGPGSNSWRAEPPRPFPPCPRQPPPVCPAPRGGE